VPGEPGIARSDHSQKGTETFLKQTLRYACLLQAGPPDERGDLSGAHGSTGNDSVGNIKVCWEEKAHYIIKRNLRRETPEEWREIARECGELQEPRPGKQACLLQAGVDGGALREETRH